MAGVHLNLVARSAGESFIPACALFHVPASAENELLEWCGSPTKFGRNQLTCRLHDPGNDLGFKERHILIIFFRAVDAH